MAEQTPSPSSIVEEAVAAYNALDYDTYATYFKPDLKFVHHNRGISHDNRDEFLAMVKMFSDDLIPDRRLGDAVRTIESGDIVMREQTYGGMPIADVEGIAKKGEEVLLEFCTVYVIDGDQIAEYHEYG